MTERINKLYTPAELKAAVEALQNNKFHPFHESEATAIVKALFTKGFRIVYVGKINE